MSHGIKKLPPTTVYLASAVPVSIIVNLTFLSAIFVATKDLNAAPWQLGLLGAAMTGTYAALCPIFSRFLARTAHRLKGIAVCLLYVTVGAAAPHVRSVWSLMALVMLLGIAGAIYWPMIEGVICEGCTRARMRRNLGTYCVLWCAGVTAGTLMAGRLYDLSSSAAFYGTGALAVAVLIVFAVTPSPGAAATSASCPTGPNNDYEEVPQRVATDFLYLSRVLGFLSYFTFGSLRSLFPKYGAQEGMSATLVSVLLFTAMFAQTGVFLVFRNTAFWHYRYWPLLVATAVASTSFFLLGHVSSVWLLPGLMLCIGLFLGTTYFSSIYYSMARPKAGIESAAWHETTLGLGSTFGPIVGGLFAGWTDSIIASFALSGAVAAVGLGAATRFLVRASRRRAAPGSKHAQLQ